MIDNKCMILITGGSGFIGTNLQEIFLEKGYSFVNFDKSKPENKLHNAYWHEGNIMELSDLRVAFEKYHPQIVVHLAARTDTASLNLEDYIENTKGTQNVVDIIKEYPCVKRCIMTSTQYVYKSLTHPFPASDTDYMPHTVYGESKKIAELYVRNAGLQCCWTIVRPANVWGPWHMRYPVQLWKIIDQGLYFHPTKRHVVRTYAYVKNLVFQIVQILNATEDEVNQRTFYLGDLPLDSIVWLSELTYQIKGGKLHYIPSCLMWCAAVVGEVLGKFGIQFPMYMTRYRNMLEDFYAPTNITVAKFGVRNSDLSENMAETVEWLHNEAQELFPYWARKKK